MKNECSSLSVFRSLVIREWANHKQEGLMLEQVFFIHLWGIPFRNNVSKKGDAL